jgi:hypothetical protein
MVVKSMQELRRIFPKHIDFLVLLELIRDWDVVVLRLTEDHIFRRAFFMPRRCLFTVISEAGLGSIQKPRLSNFSPDKTCALVASYLWLASYDANRLLATFMWNSLWFFQLHLNVYFNADPCLPWWIAAIALCFRQFAIKEVCFGFLRTSLYKWRYCSDIFCSRTRRA